jgi:hypothetical protein
VLIEGAVGKSIEKDIPILSARYAVAAKRSFVVRI